MTDRGETARHLGDSGCCPEVRCTVGVSGGPCKENCRAYDVVDPVPWMNQTGQSMSTDLQRDRREPSIRNLKRLLEVVVNGTLKEQIKFAFGREYERSTSTVGCSWSRTRLVRSLGTNKLCSCWCGVTYRSYAAWDALAVEPRQPALSLRYTCALVLVP